MITTLLHVEFLEDQNVWELRVRKHYKNPLNGKIHEIIRIYQIKPGSLQTRFRVKRSGKRSWTSWTADYDTVKEAFTTFLEMPENIRHQLIQLNHRMNTNESRSCGTN